MTIMTQMSTRPKKDAKHFDFQLPVIHNHLTKSNTI